MEVRNCPEAGALIKSPGSDPKGHYTLEASLYFWPDSVRSSMDPAQSKLVKSYSKTITLEMVLRTYGKWRNIYSSKSPKTQSVVFEPRPSFPLLPAQWDSETLHRVSIVKDTGLLPPPPCSFLLKGYPPGRGRSSDFSHSAHSYLLLRLNSGQVHLRSGGFLLPSTPQLVGQRLSIGHRTTENPGAPTAHPLSCGMKDPHWER